jgi:hypothetical protein
MSRRLMSGPPPKLQDLKGSSRKLLTELYSGRASTAHDDHVSALTGFR